MYIYNISNLWVCIHVYVGPTLIQIKYLFILFSRRRNIYITLTSDSTFMGELPAAPLGVWCSSLGSSSRAVDLLMMLVTHANKKCNYYLFYDVYDLHWVFCASFLRRSVILLFYFYTSCIVDWFHMCSSSHLASMTVTNKVMSIYIYTSLF